MQVPLGPIDDHEYPFYRTLNPSGNWPSAVEDGYNRAASEFLNKARFRPIYHLGRTLSVTVFDQAALPRYMVRLLILSGTLFMISVITTRLFDYFGIQKWPSTFLGLTATLPYAAFLPWPDVIGRLGPPDSFAWLGVVFFVAFIFLYCEDGRFRKSLLLPAVLLMVGFRENYAVLLPVLLFSPFYFSRLRSLRKHASLYAAGFISLSGATLVLLTLSMQGGTDFYGKSRGVGSLGNGVMVMISSNYFANLSFAGLILLLFAPKHLKPVVARIGLLSILIMTIEFVIYEDAIFVYPRYSLVSKAIVVTCWTSAAIVTLWRLAGSSWLRRFRRIRCTSSCQLYCSVLLLAAVGGAVASPLDRQQEVSRVQQRSAKGFQILVNDIQSQVAPGHDVLILVDSESNLFVELDLLERSVSIQRFLAYALAGEAQVERVDLAGPVWNSLVSNPQDSRNCVFLGVSRIVLAPEVCVSTIRVY